MKVTVQEGTYHNQNRAVALHDDHAGEWKVVEKHHSHHRSTTTTTRTSTSTTATTTASVSHPAHNEHQVHSQSSSRSKKSSSSRSGCLPDRQTTGASSSSSSFLTCTWTANHPQNQGHDHGRFNRTTNDEKLPERANQETGEWKVVAQRSRQQQKQQQQQCTPKDQTQSKQQQQQQQQQHSSLPIEANKKSDLFQKAQRHKVKMNVSASHKNQNMSDEAFFNQKLIYLGDTGQVEELLQLISPFNTAKKNNSSTALQHYFDTVNYATALRQLTKFIKNKTATASTAAKGIASDPRLVAFLHELHAHVFQQELLRLCKDDDDDKNGSSSALSTCVWEVSNILFHLARIYEPSSKNNNSKNTKAPAVLLSIFRAAENALSLPLLVTCLGPANAPQAFAQIVWAFANLGMSAPMPMLAQLEQPTKTNDNENKNKCMTMAQFLVSYGTTQDIGNIAWACAKFLPHENSKHLSLSAYYAALVEALDGPGVAHYVVQNGSTHEISITVWALRNFHHVGYPSRLYFSWCKEIASRASYLLQRAKPHELSITAWSMEMVMAKTSRCKMRHKSHGENIEQRFLRAVEAVKSATLPVIALAPPDVSTAVTCRAKNMNSNASLARRNLMSSVNNSKANSVPPTNPTHGKKNRDDQQGADHDEAITKLFIPRGSENEDDDPSSVTANLTDETGTIDTVPSTIYATTNDTYSLDSKTMCFGCVWGQFVHICRNNNIDGDNFTCRSVVADVSNSTHDDILWQEIDENYDHSLLYPGPSGLLSAWFDSYKNIPIIEASWYELQIEKS